MPTPANLTDDELLRMYGDDFARDPAAAELARRFADYVDMPSGHVDFLDDDDDIEKDLAAAEEERDSLKALLLAVLEAPADLEKQREARRFLGLPPREDPH